MKLNHYAELFDCARLDRTTDGVLTVHLHTNHGPMLWDSGPHSQLPELFGHIGADMDNRAVVLTGTGDIFIDWSDEIGAGLAAGAVSVRVWDRLLFEGKRLIGQLLDIDVPVIAAVNGPAHAHAEIALLSDIVLVAPSASFRDSPHFPGGLVPGDGAQVLWPLLLGPNRARYFMLTGETIAAERSVELGIAAELVRAEDLLGRAQALAASIAVRNPTLLRYSRHLFTLPFKKRMLEELELGLALEAVSSLSNAEWLARDRKQPTT